MVAVTVVWLEGKHAASAEKSDMGRVSVSSPAKILFHSDTSHLYYLRKLRIIMRTNPSNFPSRCLLYNTYFFN